MLSEFETIITLWSMRFERTVRLTRSAVVIWSIWSWPWSMWIVGRVVRPIRPIWPMRAMCYDRT